jgi:hypothetical protein
MVILPEKECQYADLKQDFSAIKDDEERRRARVRALVYNTLVFPDAALDESMPPDPLDPDAKSWTPNAIPAFDSEMLGVSRTMVHMHELVGHQMAWDEYSVGGPGNIPWKTLYQHFHEGKSPEMDSYMTNMDRKVDAGGRKVYFMDQPEFKPRHFDFAFRNINNIIGQKPGAAVWPEHLKRYRGAVDDKTWKVYSLNDDTPGHLGNIWMPFADTKEQIRHRGTVLEEIKRICHEHMAKSIAEF